MKFRHLPVLSNTDITHNFEQLQSVITDLEPRIKGAVKHTSSESSGGSEIFKSNISTEQESTTKEEEPKLLPTPDRVEFTLASETLVSIWARVETKAKGESGGMYLFIDGVVAQGKQGEFKGLNARATFTRFYLKSDGSNDNFGVTASEATATTVEDAGQFVIPLAAGLHKVELRMGGKESKWKNRLLYVIVS